MRAHSGTGAGWALRRRVAAFLQKGLAKNLQAPLWRGRVLQSDKENAGAKHIAHPQSPARVDAERCYLRPVRCKSAGGTGRPQSADGAGTHDAQAGSGIDDGRKARPPPPRAGRRTRLLCGHGICGVGCRHEVRCGGGDGRCEAGWRHEVHCGAGAAAFLQKGLAKNLQAPLRRGRVLQSGKKARPTPLRSQGRASKTGTEENGAASADSRLFPRRVKSGSGKIALDGFPGCAGAAAEQFVASAAASVQCCPDPIGIAA